ncbi:hypothetical protein Q3G72_023227 [Acer saccharum]|nr:hypothetical protein Q3G72_023227 [Acer saccharum]
MRSIYLSSHTYLYWGTIEENHIGDRRRVPWTTNRVPGTIDRVPGTTGRVPKMTDITKDDRQGTRDDRPGTKDSRLVLELQPPSPLLTLETPLGGTPTFCILLVEFRSLVNTTSESG